MKAPLFVLAVLALIFVACGAPQPQPAQQADRAIVYATPKPAVASGYGWTVERAQDILEGYGFTLEGTDYRGTSDCNVQACMGYFKGSAPVMVHVQLFIERDTLQGIVAAAWNSPSDSMLESLGFAAYDILRARWDRQIMPSTALSGLTLGNRWNAEISAWPPN